MEESVKLPSSSYEQLCRIVMGYAQIGKAASLGDVSKRTGIHDTVISGNNKFLMNLGIIEGGKNKVITPVGKKLGDALSHDLESEVSDIYRDIVDSNEFLRNLVGAIRIRKGMDEAALKAHIGYSAGAAKSSSVTTGTGTVVEILKRSGAIEERDGKLLAVGQSSSASSGSAVGGVVVAPIQSPTGLQATMVQSSGSGLDVRISIDVQIVCKPSEIDDLGTKIRQLLVQLRESDENIDGNEEQG